MKPPPLQAGELRDVIELLAPTLVQDSAGGTQVLQQTTVFARVRASVESLSGRELYNAQQLVAEVTHRVLIRWHPQVIALMNLRSVGDGRRFQIQYVNRGSGRRIYLELLCVERNDGIIP